MEIQNQNTNVKAPYTNDLNIIEAQIHEPSNKETEQRVTSIKKECFGEVCCAKFCIAITISSILSPFAICDIYYATNDTTCVTQSQTSHNLTINLQSYLLASGIMTILSIGTFNFCLFVLDFNWFQPSDLRNRYNKSEYEEAVDICSKVYGRILNTFSIAWIILGCVLFWAYTDIESCSQTVHDYLFARFIFVIISYCANLKSSSE